MDVFVPAAWRMTSTSGYDASGCLDVCPTIYRSYHSDAHVDPTLDQLTSALTARGYAPDIERHFPRSAGSTIPEATIQAQTRDSYLQVDIFSTDGGTEVRFRFEGRSVPLSWWW
jgi:hypothetical protein